jgi:hypothetical protein
MKALAATDKVIGARRISAVERKTDVAHRRYTAFIR